MSDSPEDLGVDFDVVVIGAGISGLVAARELETRSPKTRILILEAKDRVGGRTLGVEMKTAKYTKEYFDLGGQWVGRTQRHILGLLDELDFKTYEQYEDGDKIAQMGVSKPRKYSSKLPVTSLRQFTIFEIFDSIASFAKLTWLTRFINPFDYFSSKKSTNLDDMSVSKWSRENCWTRANQDAIDIATRIVAQSAGNYLNLCECVGDGAQALKINGGAFQVAQNLAGNLENIRLEHAVSEIIVDEQTGITCIKGIDLKNNQVFTFKCLHVISAIPPNQCGKIQWTPSLPDLKRRLFDGCMQGNLIKFVVTFEVPFWKTNGLSGEIVSTGRTPNIGEVHPIICTYDGTTAIGAPAIIGFMNEEYADKPFNERCNAVVNDLIRFMGDDALRHFLDYKDKIWAHEQYNGGCPSIYVPPGQMDAYQYIRQPFYNVHFAGTESATEWIGYMSGAVQSGYRSAHEVLQCMEKFDKVTYEHLKGTIYDQEYCPPKLPSNIYDETRSPWWRRLFFMSGLLFGIYAYSRHYRLSIVARTVKPIENRLVKYFFDVDWPE
ncbi:unnamed protein product [Caenorhabditis angaria]|uniref:Amine oxidase n=1 Tax=Caenorhabditis angaria TaxID=860376 RepID=A0A9P1N7Q1_9PELO|nr:unnamed protein product [Caenorhabditis angaria]